MVSLNAESSALPTPLRTVIARWIVPNEQYLWTAVICAFALDLATTAFGLSVGLVEANPIAASLLAAHGFASLVGLKVLVLVVGVVCRTVVPARHAAAIPLGLALPSAAAVVANSFSIAVAI